MPPQRPTGSPAPAARSSGPIPFPPPAHSFESLKARVVAKLEDRLDPSASKRMPSSLLRQSLRQQAEQVADQEARGLVRTDRDRLVDEVLAELLGYGPLAELFKDPAVREVMVTGPHAVIVRREGGAWLPTSVTFRDEAHLRAALDRLATHADPVGPVTASVNLFDLQLPIGFRVVAVVPPAALEHPATAAFIRSEPTPAVTPEPIPAAVLGRPPAALTGSGSGAARLVPGSPTASPLLGSGPAAPPASPASQPTADPLARHRKRIIERLISKLANLGVYDLQRVEIGELRKVVAAFVREYADAEKVYLSDADQGRLTLEILTAMNR